MTRPRFRIRRAHALAAATLSICLAPPLAACGPWGIAVHFWLPHQPGPAQEGFLAGQLGILDTELDPIYTYVAYRHLAGLEPGGNEAQGNLEAMALMWPEPSIVGAIDPMTTWREARARVPGLEPVGWFSRSRSVTVEDGDNTYYSYFLNCLDDGLLTAAQTLSARIEQFGASSRPTWWPVP